ncbi:MAG: hypothetical protein MUE36_02215 [Acidimicrobiales bacterium]|jgi:hypothetical protein|nr:hypothetical protein [Acidimicrobiales bacterium]
MTPEDASRATADAIQELGGAFMTDGATYARGGEAGFSGIDFYVLGRGGVLGDVDADVVSAAFYFWNPDQIRTQWDSGRAVMSPAEGAALFAEVAADYGDAHIADHDGLGRLGELLTTVVDATSPAGASLFAGWRTHPTPGPDRPKALVQHQVNALRELRGAYHGGAVLAAGLHASEAVAFRSAFMAPIFGWDLEGMAEPATFEARWKVAEAGTDAAMARALSVLDADELDELVALLTAVHTTWKER